MNALRVTAACVIVIVWTVAYLAPYVSPHSPDPPPELSGIMLLTAAWLFGSAARDARKRLAEAARRAADSLDTNKRQEDE